ncbi:hypothetical protein ACQP3J_28560, partial [Escherichia coli]
MDKSRRGQTTFVIMVSPLPGKYELQPPRARSPSRSTHFERTVTVLATPPRRARPPDPAPRP